MTYLTDESKALIKLVKELQRSSENIQELAYSNISLNNTQGIKNNQLEMRKEEKHILNLVNVFNEICQAYNDRKMEKPIERIIKARRAMQRIELRERKREHGII